MAKMDETIKAIEKVIIETETEIIIPAKDTEKERVEYAFLLNSFFEQNFSHPREILDYYDGTPQKREARVYVCLKFVFENNTFLLPLKKNLQNISGNPTLNKAWYPVPSTTKPHAGLDFRRLIIVNDESLYRIDAARISEAQRDIMQNNFEDIKTSAIKYITGFIKAAQKKRVHRENLYKFSSLKNYTKELKIE